MDTSIHQRIRVLLEETNDAFSCCGNVNGDFADFATLALSDFKSVLSDPALTSRELKVLIRKSMTRCRDEDPQSWSMLMAQYVAKAANSDSPESL